MTRIKIGSMKVPGPLPALMLVLALALTALPPGSSRAGDLDSANESVLEVWRLFDEGDLDGALGLAGEIHGAEGDSLLVLTALPEGFGIATVIGLAYPPLTLAMLNLRFKAEFR